MRIALVVDNPTRDLPGLVLVALRLCQRGATCFMTPMNLQALELGALAPDLALLNYCRTVNQSLVRRLHDRGTQVGVLDTEGAALMESFDGYTKALAPDPQIRYRVACFLSWGSRLAEEARRAGWYKPEQIEVTGSPRFDYYVAPWRDAALALSMDADQVGRPLVLINANFATVNPQFQTREQEAEMLIKRFGYAPSFVAEIQRTQETALGQLVTLANRLAEQFPGVTFIYRPHPFERAETYRSLLADHPNLRLIKQGTVDGWILRSAAVIQRGCSTAIEAGMAGVPALSPTWIPTFYDMQSADAASIRCPSEADLIVALEAILTGRFTVPADVRSAFDRVISDWFFRVDGCAHERVAGAVLNCLKANGATAENGGSASKWRRAKGWGETLLRWARWRVRSDAAWVRSEKFFDEGAVKQIADALCASVDADGRWDIRSIRIRRATPADYRLPYTGRSIVLSPA